MGLHYPIMVHRVLQPRLVTFDVGEGPESLISCRIFGVVRACGWMRELMLQTAPGEIYCWNC
jgi:hypothetical protein